VGNRKRLLLLVVIRLGDRARARAPPPPLPTLRASTLSMALLSSGAPAVSTPSNIRRCRPQAGQRGVSLLDRWTPRLRTSPPDVLGCHDRLQAAVVLLDDLRELTG